MTENGYSPTSVLRQVEKASQRLFSHGLSQSMALARALVSLWASIVSAILLSVGRDASVVGRNTREGVHSHAHDPSSHPALARGSEPL